MSTVPQIKGRLAERRVSDAVGDLYDIILDTYSYETDNRQDLKEIFMLFSKEELADILTEMSVVHVVA